MRKWLGLDAKTSSGCANTGPNSSSFSGFTRFILIYLEGQRDLVSRFIMGITGVIIWVIGVTDLVTKPP